MLLLLSASTCEGSLLEVKTALFSKGKNKMFCKLVVKVKERKGAKITDTIQKVTQGKLQLLLQPNVTNPNEKTKEVKAGIMIRNGIWKRSQKEKM